MKPDAVMIAYALNRFGKLSQVCKFTNCEDYQKLSRLVRGYLNKGIISKHIVIPLEILPIPCSVAILYKHQLVKESCFDKKPRVITRFLTHVGKPVEIDYIAGECEFVEEHVNFSTCGIELCDQITKTLVPRYSNKSNQIEFEEFNKYHKPALDIDQIDITAIFEIFRLYNPPLLQVRNSGDIIEYINNKIGVRNIRYHYYSHMRRFLLENYVIRNNGDYMILATWTPSIDHLKKILENLLDAGLFTGYWQIHLLSTNPALSIVHGWGYYEKIIEQRSGHPRVDSSAYTLYHILGVSYE
ncbi:MAG: hypothetical protein QXE81_01290 [Desulfurococcaceae archaeon]